MTNEHQSDIDTLNRRMDTQESLLREIRDQITAHIEQGKSVGPALEELATLWKGSKIIIPMIAALATAAVAIVAWAKDHIKW